MKSKHMSEKELGKLSPKLRKEERDYQKLMRKLEKAKKYHKAETQLVLWSYPKMLLVKAVVPWKWKLRYYPASKPSGATGAQMTLTELGKGAQKKDGRAYREVLHRGESRILQLEMGLMAQSKELMGKGLHKTSALKIIVRKRRL